MANKRRKEMSSRGLLIPFVAIFIIALFMIPTFYLTSSAIQGNEFSPDNFQERSFAYRRIPGTKIRLSSTTLGTSASPATKFILNHLPNTGRAATWHVIDVSNGYSENVHGPKILLNYLKNMDPDGAKVWDRWSQNHEKLAAVLWPLVQQAAFQELYWCVPAMLHAAELETEPESLRAKLTIICIAGALEKAKSLRSNSNAANTSLKSQAELSSWAKGLAVGMELNPEVIELLSQFPDSPNL